MTSTQPTEKFNELQPDFSKAADFAFDSLPTRMVHLTAIHPSGKRPIIGKSFAKTDSGKAAAMRWMADADRSGFGLYWNCNEVWPPLGPGHAKASEADISTVYFQHVDVDPPEGTPPDKFEAWRTDTLAKIKAAPQQPSLIIGSGNGLGLFFAVDPVTVTDDNRKIIKTRNVGLSDKFGGDDCEDICHVMRLPFTVNRPNAKKIKAGRVPVLAGIVSDDRDLIAYTSEQFEAVDVSNDDPGVAEKTSTSGTAYEKIGSPEIPETVDLSTLDDALRALIVDGAAAGDDRSRVVYEVACNLRRNGWSDGDILAVLTKRNYGISDHIFDQKQREPDEQASRVIDDMNRKGIVREADADDEFAADPVADVDDLVSGEAKKPVKISFTPFKTFEPTAIEPRDWLYGMHYIRKFVVADISPGGGGKSSEVLVEAVAMALGKDLLETGRTYPRRLKVMYWNGEDPVEEVQRRIAAICIHYELNMADLEGYLYFDSGRNTPIKIATEVGGNMKMAKPLVEALIAEVKSLGIDVMIIDPFVSSHSLAENDNTRIDTAIKEGWVRIAEFGNCCVNLVHHTRKIGKGQEYSAADARGASAIVDAARDVRTFNMMTEKEADAYRIRQDRWRYFRVASDKPNMAARGATSPWRYMESVSLPNPRQGVPPDNVGVVTPWFPDMPDDIQLEAERSKAAADILKLIDDGKRITKQQGGDLTVAKVAAKLNVSIIEVERAFEYLVETGAVQYLDAYGKTRAGYARVVVQPDADATAEFVEDAKDAAAGV
jgi:hypothetical protein